MIINAPAKINLLLNVLKKREDNYHELDSIMISVSIYDKLTLTKNKSGFINISCDKPSVPTDRKNIVYKAANLMKTRYSINMGFDIAIEKRIPMDAGMGGGSTDAAAVILGINKICDLNKDRLELETIGKEIGADVPFCIRGGIAVAQGIGEKLDSFNIDKDIHLVILKPEIGISTKLSFQKLSEIKNFGTPTAHLCKAAVLDKDYKKAFSYIKNDMYKPSILINPELEKYKILMDKTKALYTCMTGSGSAFFGIYATKKEAMQATYELSKKGYRAYCAKALNSGIEL